jgi:putative membrane protein (TIGR04086 family)
MKNKIEYSKDTNSNSVLIVSKGVLIALIISAVLIIVYGLLLSFTSLSESSMPAVITAKSTVSIALSGIYVAVKVESRGWLNGALMGLIYMVVLFLISLLFKTGAAFDKFVLFRIFMGFVIGALSGIIGINLK